MDPNTGAILAMVSAPEFNPNWFAKGITTAQWNQLNNDKNHPLTIRLFLVSIHQVLRLRLLRGRLR